MIRRTDDYSALSDKELNKIANIVKKAESKKLYDTCEDINKANLIATELKVKGFKTEIFKVENKYQVFASAPDSVSLENAEKSGQFKKLAWGRYSFQKESAVGMFDFNFDDGSIWRVSQDDEGNQILIKEVDDENEEEVVRGVQNLNHVKTAGCDNLKYVSKNTMSKIASILYGPQNEDWIQLILSSDHQSILRKLDEKFDEFLNDKIANCKITNDDEIKEVKNLIFAALDSEISSTDNLDNFLNHYIQYKKDKIGSQRKYFS